ncbi:MAG: methyltransferase domain-containing protein [Chloroflexaceae bacterium]|nr:methyltransferase domain-containing protein [Chloroflexaceae bacterium]
MRICYFGTYERDYPRNALMIEAMRRSGLIVYECHASIWQGKRDKSGVYRGLAAVTMALRVVLAYVGLLLRYWRMPAHDVLMVGYIGQLDMLLAWGLSRLRAVPLVFNPMLSLYDTFCDDRNLVVPRSMTGRLFWWLDALACHAADHSILDTPENVEYFCQTFKLPPERLSVVPVGTDDRLFRPVEEPVHHAQQPFDVVFVGKLIPLQGSETILHAAALLRDAPVHLTVIGSGQQHDLVHRLAQELALTNVTLIDWIEYERLPWRYAQATLCLGIFGDSAKADRVIPNKVFQALAVGRPVITADTAAIRSAFAVGREIWVSQPGDAADLAQQIRYLIDHPDVREGLAQQGYQAFWQRYRLDCQADAIRRSLAQVLPGLLPQATMRWGTQPEFFGPRHRFREEYLFRAVQQHVSGLRVLDAACGGGSLARRLAASGWDVTALDLSAEFISYLAGQPDAARLQLMRGDITRLPYADGQFNVVIAGEVLEHLSDDRTALREIWRVLAPGGIAVISVPADPQQWDWIDDWAGHVRRYRLPELRQRLQAEHLVPLQLHHFGFPTVRLFHRYIYQPHVRQAWLAESPASALAVQGWRKQLASHVLYWLFQTDHLFNRLPWGMGLIAVAQKPRPLQHSKPEMAEQA